jgi:hypothetical protein
MKAISRYFRSLRSLAAVASLALAGGCVISDGRVTAGAVLYWPLPVPGFYGGPWLDGHVWYRSSGAFGHPPPFGGTGPHLPNRVRPGPGPRR